jgi:hypothetical protein
MINSLPTIQFWGEAVNTAVYQRQRSPNEGLKRCDHDGYQTLYKTSNMMQHRFGNPTHNANRNKVSYEASLYNLCRFGCYAHRLILEGKHCSKLGPRSTPCRMVAYTPNSNTLCRIWDLVFQGLQAQSASG